MHSAEDNVIGVEETDRLVAAMKSEQATDIRYSRFSQSDDKAAKGTL